jgi:hypothetical protein
LLPPAYSSATQSCGLLADLDLGQPLVAADPMLGMDDEVAGRQRRQLGQEGVGALLALAPPHQPVAKHVLLGQHRDLRRGEAMVERKHQQRGDVLRAERFLPVADQLLPGQPWSLSSPASRSRAPVV